MRSYFEIPKIYRESIAGFGIDKIEVDQSKFYKKNVIFFDISRWFIRYQSKMDGK